MTAPLTLVECLDVTSDDGIATVLGLLESGLISSMITDPPFSARVHDKATSAGSAGAGPQARDFGFACITPELRGVLATIAAAIPRWSIIHSDYEGATAWWADMAAADVEWIRLVPWVRWSQPQITGDRPGSQSEAVLHFHSQLVGPRGGVKPRAKSWNGPGGLMSYEARSMRGRDKHPTEKPLDLALSLVSYFADPGEVILDPCAGHGTTGLAARILGRGCVMFECDPGHAKIARARACVGGPLRARDQVRAGEWSEEVAREAQAVLAAPPAADGSDANARRRAQSRLDDAERVRMYLAGVNA